MPTTTSLLAFVAQGLRVAASFNILLAMGARFAENGFFYIYATFVLAYAT